MLALLILVGSIVMIFLFLDVALQIFMVLLMVSVGLACFLFSFFLLTILLGG